MSDDIRTYDIYSEKYDIHGTLIDAGPHLVVKLQFEYVGRQIEMGLENSFIFLNDDFKAEALKLMESYVEKTAVSKARKTQLHYWYINKVVYGDDEYVCAHGNVTGHNRLQDSIFINTSEVLWSAVDWEHEELLVQTRNTRYHCPLAYCDFDRQDENAKLVLEYEKICEIYRGKTPKYEIEEGNVLLVVSNFDDYYFHSCYYKPVGSTEPVRCRGSARIGMLQDSYLIMSSDAEIDLRYFPHYQNMEMYSQHTAGCPWFILNIGDISLYFVTSVGTLKIGPGERKRVCKENVESEPPLLPGGDLYPAAFY